jgi:predicted nucleic-acid-binding protein
LKVVVDTNVLVRFIVRDDEQQARIADRTLRRATTVVLTLPCLCELVWVLSRSYRFSRQEIAQTLEVILQIPNVDLQRSTVIHGVAVLRGGGDFADGVIAHEGRQLGAELFVSFDRKAVRLVSAHGDRAELL